MRCLEHDPDKRWADVAQLARAIAPYGTGMCAALVDGIELTLRQRLRRYSGTPILLHPRTEMSITLEAPAPTPAKPAKRGWMIAVGVASTLVAGAAASYVFVIAPQKNALADAHAEVQAAPIISAAPSTSVSTSPVVQAKPPATTASSAKPIASSAKKPIAKPPTKLRH